ncbi:MAG TPA: hypothetical protein VH439_17290 [Gemmatimonadales bacterium]|jgi:hypothetical protein
MTPRPIKADRAARLAALNPGVDPATLASLAKADYQARGRKRRQVGATFQRELVATHENYLNRGWGFVLEQHPPFIRRRTGWFPSGPGRCDFAGHVNVLRTSPSEFRIDALGTPTPVYFDAKVLGTEHATYTHLVRDQHQLIDLRAALRGGGYAFLLVCAPHVERAFLLDIGQHFAALMRGTGVKLYEHRVVHVCHPLLPSCEWSPAVGWDWAPHLRHLSRGELGP